MVRTKLLSCHPISAWRRVPYSRDRRSSGRRGNVSSSQLGPDRRDPPQAIPAPEATHARRRGAGREDDNSERIRNHDRRDGVDERRVHHAACDRRPIVFSGGCRRTAERQPCFSEGRCRTCRAPHAPFLVIHRIPADVSHVFGTGGRFDSVIASSRPALATAFPLLESSQENPRAIEIAQRMSHPMTSHPRICIVAPTSRGVGEWWSLATRHEGAHDAPNEWETQPLQSPGVLDSEQRSLVSSGELVAHATRS